MVVPSGIAQAVHGRSHLAIPGQIGPSRHHHCPAHLAAEPPRDITPPGPSHNGSVSAMTRSGGISPRKRVCVLPFRDPGEQDVRQGAYRDVFTAFPEGQNTDTRPLLESPAPGSQLRGKGRRDPRLELLLIGVRQLDQGFLIKLAAQHLHAHRHGRLQIFRHAGRQHQRREQ